MFKSMKMLGVVVLSASLLVACEKADTTQMQHGVLEAGNLRDITRPVLLEGLQSGDVDTMTLTLKTIGNIGGPEAGVMLMPYLTHDNKDVRFAAAFAAGIAGDPSMLTIMQSLAGAEQDDAVAARMYQSIGYLSEKEDLGYFVEAVNTLANPVRLRGALDGMVIAVSYMRVNATELGDLQFQKILSLTGKDGELGKAAAFLLGRLTGLPDVVTVADITRAAESTKNNETRTYMLRVLRRFEGIEDAFYMRALDSGVLSVQLEALQAMKARMASSDRAKAVVREIAEGPDGLLKMTALSSPTQPPEGYDFQSLAQAYDNQIASDSDWVATKALLSLNHVDKAKALATAKTWFDTGSDYRKGKAIPLLVEDAAYKEKIQAVAEDPSNPHLYYIARRALDLDVSDEEQDFGASPTVSAKEALAATKKSLHFMTSRGNITVQMLEDAPYAAHNFVSLAEQGGFNGMLFHRVIGNFVAQAGERTDDSFREWKTIREEWSTVSHEIGTVGVATSGKDTGTLQFFFNTAHNRYLDGRYTVFGRVTDGLDVMMALEEGDIINMVHVMGPKE